MTRRLAHRLMAMILPACAIVTAAFTTDASGETVVREERAVTINGASETWRLVWDAPPATVCGPEDVSLATTCPCSGLAYGEYGKLSLVRTRDGREVERMDLRPLFGQFDDPDDKVAGLAYATRWPLAQTDADREARHDGGLIADIKRRPAPVIMTFADYDRNGAATEFLLQVGTLPCGKNQFAAIGVAGDGRLRALSSAAHPDAPLTMPLGAWQALAKSDGPTVVPTLTCGDHGSDSRVELVVSAAKGVIRVKSREYSCPAKGKSEKLIQEVEQ
jgi:hypothetical protein